MHMSSSVTLFLIFESVPQLGWLASELQRSTCLCFLNTRIIDARIQIFMLAQQSSDLHACTAGTLPPGWSPGPHPFPFYRVLLSGPSPYSGVTLHHKLFHSSDSFCLLLHEILSSLAPHYLLGRGHDPLGLQNMPLALLFCSGLHRQQEVPTQKATRTSAFVWLHFSSNRLVSWLPFRKKEN